MIVYKIVTDMPLGSRDTIYSTQEKAEEAFENARFDYLTGLDLLNDMDPYEYPEVEDDDGDWDYDIEEIEIDDNDERIQEMLECEAYDDE